VGFEGGGNYLTFSFRRGTLLLTDVVWLRVGERLMMVVTDEGSLCV
jgi:hypothetical protein